MKPAESFINQPVRSLQEMLRVIALSDSRLPQIIPDGIYGRPTISAVNRFQQIHGLPITGITDQATWDKVAEIYDTARINVEPAKSIEILINRNQTLEPGDSGAYVYFLQIMLMQLHNQYPSIPTVEITGKYDRSTTEAVQNFQKLIDVPASGITDKRTWNSLVNHFTLLTHDMNSKKANKNPLKF